MRKPKPNPRKKKPKKKTRQRQRIGDYRIFVGAFPKGPEIDQLQRVRQQIDPKTAAITPPHVTLAGTYWRTGPPTTENERGLIEKLTTLSAELRPFTLQLGGIYTFGQRVIYLGVQPTDKLLASRNCLLKVMGQDKHRQFKPHLTMAMRLKGTDFADVLAKLQQSEWENGRFSHPIDELHLMQRGPKDPAWRLIHTLPLKPLPANVQLRPVQQDDLDYFFVHQQQPAGRHMAAFTAKDPNDRAAFLEHWQKILADPTVFSQTVVVDEKTVGHIACHHWFGQPEISYWIDEAFWGIGIATSALQQLLTLLPLRPLHARVAQDNAASLRVLQKCGFIVTGESTGFAHGRGEEIGELLLTLPDD